MEVRENTIEDVRRLQREQDAAMHSARVHTVEEIELAFEQGLELMIGRGRSCYIAGPMRGYAEFNYPAFNEAADELRKFGWKVFNPAETDAEVHLAADQLIIPLREYMKQDLVDVCNSDVVFVLEGWEKSEGAGIEVEVARRLKIPVVRFPDGTEVRFDWADREFPLDETSKASNPKDAVGSGKLPLHLWPASATAMGCLGLLDGMLKYGRSNWREAGVRATIYLDALERHAKAFAEGENIDPDSGVPHLSHMLACIAILVDAGTTGNLVDDRNYNGAGYRELVSELTPHVERLKEKHSDKSPHHYTIGDEADW